MRKFRVFYRQSCGKRGTDGLSPKSDSAVVKSAHWEEKIAKGSEKIKALAACKKGLFDIHIRAYLTVREASSLQLVSPAKRRTQLLRVWGKKREILGHILCSKERKSVEFICRPNSWVGPDQTHSLTRGRRNATPELQPQGDSAAKCMNAWAPVNEVTHSS
jgi:hypothetical protein